MNVAINLNGMNELQAALDRAEEAGANLKKAISDINSAIRNLSLEINQPKADTNG